MFSSTIVTFLQKIGLSEVETVLYLGLLENGASTILEISKHTNIKRATAHFNIQSLIDKGLVTQSIQGSRRQLIAEPPERLEYLIQQKEEGIKELKNLMPNTIKIINNLIPKNHEDNGIDVRYYEGKNSVKLVYNETLKSNQVYSFADLQRYYEVYPNTIDMFVKALEQNPKREVWDLLVDSPLSRQIGLKERYNRYYVKLLPKSDFFSGFGFVDYIIYDEKIAIVQLDPEDTKATVIESKQIALSLKALHRSMWELLPNIV